MTEAIKQLNIYQRLIEVLKEVRYIEKETKKVNGQYRFVSHDAVTGAAYDAFIKHGVFPAPRIVKNDISTIEIKKYNKFDKVNIEETSFICTVEVEYDFINIDNPSDKITGINGLGQGIDSQDKACGKAISYACKYALLKALGIKTGDDPEKDTDFKITKNPIQKLGNVADESMKEVFEERNQGDFEGIKAILESAASQEELKEVWMSKENTKILNRLKKYKPELYSMLENAKNQLKEELE